MLELAWLVATLDYGIAAWLICTPWLGQNSLT